MKLQITSTTFLVTTLPLFLTFTVQHGQGYTITPSTKQTKTSSTRCYIASSSKIDNELSSTTFTSSSSSSSSSTIMSEIHSILDDGHGHINKDLATSIWTWENENLQKHNDNVPFPLASKLKYSTRDGLRLVESIAKEMDEVDSIVEGDHLGGERYNDLVQEGVVALMKCMVIWDNESGSHDDNFESFASREIRKSMRKYLVESSDGVGVMKMNLDLLRNGVTELQREKVRGRTDVAVTMEDKKISQIVQPLREAVLDENPTPDEIALSEMIRDDIVAFLERTLNSEELKVIGMRFGLEEAVVGTSIDDIALTLGKTVVNVQSIEETALKKLRTSFSNDYIGAYLDDDNTEEVSL